MRKPYLDRQRAELHNLIEKIGLWEARQVLEAMEDAALARVAETEESRARSLKARRFNLTV